MKRFYVVLIALLITQCTHATVYIIEGAEQKGLSDRRYPPQTTLSRNVTNQFFNRKGGDNWMNETFGDPVPGSNKELVITYRKINKDEFFSKVSNCSSFNYNSLPFTSLIVNDTEGISDRLTNKKP